MNKMDILSLPTYDHDTDTFKDGALPKGVDGYFAKTSQHTKYYSWIKPVIWLEAAEVIENMHFYLNTILLNSQFSFLG